MFKLREEQISIAKLLILIAIAYIFSISMRLIWIHEMSSSPQFFWNHELMISNNDGYNFAEGARDILQGHHEKNDLSPVTSPLSRLTALLSKIIPVSFETLILYMPSFVGSLIVIPLILIGRALNQTTLGFIAALIASIANSYYNRTMVGYYDTDMFNIVFPAFEMYSLILALTHQRNRYLIPITLSIALYQWWYPQAYTLDTGLFLMILGYTVLFDRKNLYFYKISLFILIGLLSLPLLSKVFIALFIFFIFHYFKNLPIRIFLAIFITIIGIYFFTGGIDPILAQIKAYIGRGSAEQAISSSSLHYFNVVSTVREAGNIPFSVFAERISGHTLTFILACIGYILAVIAYRPLLVTLPLVGLGFTAMFSGLRFTIYAVPVMAIGFGYLLMWSTQRIEKSWLKHLVLIVLTSIAIYPNYTHIREYMTPTVFIDQEIVALNELKKIASREDYVVTWWDYGYPIRYYSDVKTWIDGGKHNGDVNYPASYVLTAQDSLSAARMMRLFTEYTERGFQETNKTTNDFETMMAKEGYKDPNDFISALSLPEYKTPQKTRDVYLFLPLRMMEIFPTVSLFSNLDLTGKEKRPNPFFFTSRMIQDTDKTIELGQGISILKANSMLKMGSQTIPIKAFYQVGYDANHRLQIGKQTFGSEGLSVVYMASYGQFLVMDDYYFNSAYIQMFVFEQYDKNLFQPVILSPLTKIYKLKI